MSALKESSSEESLPEGPFVVIPRVGVVKVIRITVSILEHTSGLRGFPCSEPFGMEVELLKDKGRTIVCLKCHTDGVIEAIGEE